MEPSSSSSDAVTAPVPISIPNVEDLFSKFDEMSLTVAFERIVPAVKTADEQGHYLAICVNIQLAALVVNYIQTVSWIAYLFHSHLCTNSLRMLEHNNISLWGNSVLTFLRE